MIEEVTFINFSFFPSQPQNESNTYGFELPSKNASKHLWKCCTEHQAFFKLTQNYDRSSGGFGGFTSRFRYSIRNGSFGKGSLHRGVNGLRDRPPSAIVRVPSRRYHRGSGHPEISEGKKYILDQICDFITAIFFQTRFKR